MSKDKRLRLWEVIKSVLAAIFGVQSNHNRQQDFKQTDPWPFIFVGIIIILILIMTLVAITRLAIAA